MAIKKRCLIITVSALVAIYVLFINFQLYQPSIHFAENNFILVTDQNILKELKTNTKNWRHLTENETKSLSTLGRILYLDEPFPSIEQSMNKTFKILMWKYGKTIEKRHIYNYGKTRQNPFENCSVQNCILTYEDEDLDSSDIVVIHLHRTRKVTELPPREKRKSNQIWAFLTDESPFHTFLSPGIKLKAFDGIFNWSITYKMNSDIPVPYGRAVIKSSAEKFPITEEFYAWRRSRRNDVLVAIMGSNCGSKNHRWEYVRELKKYIHVDAYGGCGELKCSGHFESDCTKLNDYLFYLAFENSNCDDYLTEKLWWNAYSKNAIPVIMGATKSNLEKLLPYRSYISVEDFATPRDLATYFLYLNKTPSELISYFAWKSKYTISNEHGYFKSKSYHYCRMCEGLNYNSKKTKIYNHLEAFWNKENCYAAWDT
ncbi:hypothetical protein Trydic_g3368 [Trypoxylus dichotomus]